MTKPPSLNAQYEGRKEAWGHWEAITQEIRELPLLDGEKLYACPLQQSVVTARLLALADRVEIVLTVARENPVIASAFSTGDMAWNFSGWDEHRLKQG